QQDRGLDGEGPCELEALALNQAKALGATVRHVSEGALVEHLETEVVSVGAAAFPTGRRPDEHVSNTVIPTNGRGTWWVRAMPSLHRSAAPFDVTSPPWKTTR